MDDQRTEIYTQSIYKDVSNSWFRNRLRIIRTFDGFEEDQAIVKDVLFVQNQGEDSKRTNYFVLTGVSLHKTSIMWKILNFKVKPGMSYNDPLLLALESNINLEIED
jgi:DNA helicase HerA-like ATPase